jgi:hypothetical protein
VLAAAFDEKGSALSYTQTQVADIAKGSSVSEREAVEAENRKRKTEYCEASPKISFVIRHS